MRWLLMGFAFLAVAFSTGAAEAQQVPPKKVCVAADTWFNCATKIENAIKATKDLNVALAAASEWADRYDALYKANAQTSWPWSDQEMLRKTLEKFYDDAVGKYLDPASLAFELALAKYLPRLAAVLEFAGSANVIAFVVLLAPTPIANDFTEAGVNNKTINELLKSKMPKPTLSTIRERYPQLFSQSYSDVIVSNKNKKP